MVRHDAMPDTLSAKMRNSSYASSCLMLSPPSAAPADIFAVPRLYFAFICVSRFPIFRCCRYGLPMP